MCTGDEDTEAQKGKITARCKDQPSSCFLLLGLVRDLAEFMPHAGAGAILEPVSIVHQNDLGHADEDLAIQHAPLCSEVVRPLLPALLLHQRFKMQTPKALGLLLEQGADFADGELALLCSLVGWLSCGRGGSRLVAAEGLGAASWAGVGAGSWPGPTVDSSTSTSSMER